MRSSLLVALATAVVLGAACGGTDSSSPANDTPGATIVLSPLSVVVTEKTPDTTVYLTTTPAGGHLHWQIAAKPAWLTVTPSEGVVSGITPIRISAAATPTTEPGTSTGRVDFVATGGAASLSISFSVSANPQLSVATSTVSVAAAADTGTVVLSNPGRGTTFWSVSGQPTWLTVLPTSGTIGTNGTATVKFVPNRTTLPAGPTTVPLLFKNTSTNATVPVTLSVDVSPAPRAVAGTSRLVFSPGNTSRTVTVSNPGKGSLIWQITNRDSWVTVSPTSGTIAAGDSAKLVATSAGVNGMSGGFTITSNAVDSPAIRIGALVVTSAPAVGTQLLDYHVIDAEFNPATGLLLTVSADPSRLNVYDTETGETWSVPLSRNPCCVAVRSDGRFAAVAHDAAVSYIDLTTRQVIKMYSTTSDAFDVLLPPNGYVYVWPRTDQWVNVHGVNLTTGLEENGSDLIYAGSRAKLHPSGLFAYDIWYLSPADLEKFDFANGRAHRLGDSPYHGDYPMGYNFWFSPAGDHIMTQAGTVFRSSTSTADDMRYMGRLPNVTTARVFAEEPVRKRIYGFSSATGSVYTTVDAATRTPSIRVFDSVNLNDLGEITLNKLTSGGKTVDVDGYFLFPSVDGKRLYALVKAAVGSGVSQDWALYIIDATTLP